MFKKSENAALDKAKAMARIGIRAILRNNPQYAAAIGVFCGAVTGDPGAAIMDMVEKELGGMDDKMLAADIRDALMVAGMPDFESLDQLAILKEICGLVS